jgi:predicted metal-dependent HD superfamily phosphohydrolase
VHLLAVLEALDQLLEPADGPLRNAVLLAAWFHDAVYDGAAGEDERASAALAVERLAGRVDDAGVREVERLVLLTASHDPAPDDRAGQLLCDADLSVLGGGPEDYTRYAAAVREEYAHIPEKEFSAGRCAVLQRLLALEPLYSTARAQELWADRARTNMERELASPGQP